MTQNEQAKPRRFITTGEAAEMLLGEGFAVTLTRNTGNVPSSSAAQLEANGELVAHGYRDGTTWKFKREAVEDFIDSHHRRAAQQGGEPPSEVQLMGAAQDLLQVCRKAQDWLREYFLEVDDEDASNLWWDIQEVVDKACGTEHTCATCGNDTPAPCILCDECDSNDECE
jgi:hypothetical protein